MIKTLDMRDIFSQLHVPTHVQKEVVFEKLTALPKNNCKFIFARLDSLMDYISMLKGNYKLELSLEKEYAKVTYLVPMLDDNVSHNCILDIEFHFYLKRLEVGFIIVLDRTKNEYSNLFKMNYNDYYHQLNKILHPLAKCNTKDDKLQLVQQLEVQYTQGGEIYGIIDETVWEKSVLHYFKTYLEEYDINTLYIQVENLSNVDDKDEYLIHKSLLSITKDGVYDHLFLLIDNLLNFKYGGEIVQDINGNDKPNYIKLR